LGHLKKLIAAQNGFHIANSATNQQRPRLPVPLHELLRTDISQKIARLKYLHHLDFVKLRQLSTMNIFKPCVVSLTWLLKDTLGETLDELDDPVEFLIGGHDLFDKIEQSLSGLKAGEKIDIHLDPEEAFGDYNEMLVFLEPKNLFPPELEEGMTIEGHALPAQCNPDAPHDLIYTVTEIYPEHVVLDGNHPLAGIALRLQLTIVSVREASSKEIEKGTVGVGFFNVQPLAPGNPHLH
jgi:FKBP-type peptidyl-prolyl cis-trans isomerase SlyD